MGFRGIPESQNDNRKKVIENYKSKQMFRKVERKGKEEDISKSIDKNNQNQQRNRRTNRKTEEPTEKQKIQFIYRMNNTSFCIHEQRA